MLSAADGFCLMSNNSVNICRYSYSVGVIGGFVSIIMCCAMVSSSGMKLEYLAFGAWMPSLGHV